MTVGTANNGPGGALSWEARDGALSLRGAFTEKSDFARLLTELPADPILELSGVEHINSTGVRAWIQFLARAQEGGKKLVLCGASVTFMTQYNMISNFTKAATLTSFYLRFACGDCGEWNDTLVENQAASLPVLEGKVPCSCGGERVLDDLVDPYRQLLS